MWSVRRAGFWFNCGVSFNLKAPHFRLSGCCSHATTLHLVSIETRQLDTGGRRSRSHWWSQLQFNEGRRRGRGWRTQSGRERSAPRGTLPPDFVSLNRDAVKAGTVTPKELSQYRAQGGGAKTQRPAPTQQRGGASQRPAIPDVTFGVPTWPSSPLSDLLSHQYARRRQDEQRSRNQTSNQPQQHRMKPGADTRTSLLRKGRALPVTQPLIRRTHFTQVPPALDTFRDQEVLSRGEDQDEKTKREDQDEKTKREDQDEKNKRKDQDEKNKRKDQDEKNKRKDQDEKNKRKDQDEKNKRKDQDEKTKREDQDEKNKREDQDEKNKRKDQDEKTKREDQDEKNKREDQDEKNKRKDQDEKNKRKDQHEKTKREDQERGSGSGLNKHLLSNKTHEA
ncbi:cilia- and flagella-associated protein 77 isoform X2 [Scophthalmus maximus]|uniref:cilia- and flagella-associated protein 77 isoform X2 n=1 Tax=Scophthalmus maximus TaxID=52904 RepID=UPI001FA86B83|nr:cilia- and flagella-associated protein 77 isoform X2 [Scophthalmus maximus]